MRRYVPELGDDPLVERIVSLITKCLERNPAGGYVATPAGCLRLSERLSEIGVDCRVTVGEDHLFKFERFTV